MSNEFFNFDEVIRIECEKARADERKKVLDEVKDVLLEKADFMETEEGFYGKVVTEKDIEEVIDKLHNEIC